MKKDSVKQLKVKEPKSFLSEGVDKTKGILIKILAVAGPILGKILAIVFLLAVIFSMVILPVIMVFM